MERAAASVLVSGPQAAQAERAGRAHELLAWKPGHRVGVRKGVCKLLDRCEVCRCRGGAETRMK